MLSANRLLVWFSANEHLVPRRIHDPDSNFLIGLSHTYERGCIRGDEQQGQTAPNPRLGKQLDSGTPSRPKEGTGEDVEVELPRLVPEGKAWEWVPEFSSSASARSYAAHSGQPERTLSDAKGIQRQRYKMQKGCSGAGCDSLCCVEAGFPRVFAEQRFEEGQAENWFQAVRSSAGVKDPSRATPTMLEDRSKGEVRNVLHLPAMMSSCQDLKESVNLPARHMQVRRRGLDKAHVVNEFESYRMRVGQSGGLENAEEMRCKPPKEFGFSMRENRSRSTEIRGLRHRDARLEGRA
ncbi:hypothetical protein B0H16DRAFT_1457534 [Mycena metata]|uniref:Uncharacterized protein n=1 Tax=Mycena metata TaxID=1033252 RepID=A0AAD7J644_9AGAR|nr:hypothetical protein B0H16DRAFT_1457534 [Mycena metata]